MKTEITEIKSFANAMDENSKVKYLHLDNNERVAQYSWADSNDDEYEPLESPDETCVVFIKDENKGKFLSVSLESGNVYLDDDDGYANLWNKKPLCQIDDEIANILLPIYKKYHVVGTPDKFCDFINEVK